MTPLMKSIPLLLLCMGCTSQANNTPSVTDGGGISAFSLPSIPPTLRDPHSRADYLVQHYWDHTSWADTTVTRKDSTLEQFFVDWLSVMPYCTDTAAIGQAVRKIAQQASLSPDTSALQNLWSLSSHYLYETASPMLDESLYLPFAEAKMIWANDESDKIRAIEERRICLKNRPGEKAPDFMYVLPNGKRSRLSQCLSNAEGKVLLIFYDPDCEHCMETMEQLKTSTFLSNLTEQKQLSILAVDTEGEASSWKEKLSLLPSSWEVGWDKEMHILIDDLYALRAMPTLFLLDNQGTILLKDTTPEKIENYLQP